MTPSPASEETKISTSASRRHAICAIWHPATEDTITAFDNIARNIDKLSSSQRENIVYGRVVSADAPYPYDADGDKDEYNALASSAIFKGHYVTALTETENGDIPLEWTFGSGDGVSHLLSYTGKDLVAAQHAKVAIDPQTGQIYIEGLDGNRPVLITYGSQRKWLYKNDKYVFLGKTSVMFDDLTYTVSFEAIHSEECKSYIKLRDDGFSKIGKAAPDPRFMPLPPKDSLPKIGDIVLHRKIELDSFGKDVRASMNVSTMKPCAVNKLVMEDDNCREDALKELSLAANYVDHPGFAVVSEIWDEDGKCWTAKQAQAAKESFESRSYPYTVYLVTILPLTGFNLGPTIKNVMQVTQGPLEALEKLHADGYTHGNINKSVIFFEWAGGLVRGRLSNLRDVQQVSGTKSVTKQTKPSDVLDFALMMFMWCYPTFDEWCIKNKVPRESKTWFHSIWRVSGNKSSKGPVEERMYYQAISAATRIIPADRQGPSGLLRIYWPETTRLEQKRNLVISTVEDDPRPKKKPKFVDIFKRSEEDRKAEEKKLRVKEAKAVKKRMGAKAYFRSLDVVLRQDYEEMLKEHGVEDYRAKPSYLTKD